jgi:hypothetical protein
MLFYDHLIIFEDFESEIKDVVETSEEKEELWQLVDEIIHHTVLDCILDRLPEEHHHDFLCMFHKCPYDETLLDFLNELIEESIESVITEEVDSLKKELLLEIFEAED